MCEARFVLSGVAERGPILPLPRPGRELRGEADLGYEFEFTFETYGNSKFGVSLGHKGHYDLTIWMIGVSVRGKIARPPRRSPTELPFCQTSDAAGLKAISAQGKLLPQRLS